MALALSVAFAATITAAWAQQTAPPGGKFQRVSALVALPDFLPEMGTLYVDPKTLPAGPFLAYDRDGKLVSSIYMKTSKPTRRSAISGRPTRGGPRRPSA